MTGTIARTATNVRSGAHGPVAGMLHALFLLLFMLVAAPLAAFIPLAALAGVLAVVAWNMIEKPAIAILVALGWGDAAVLVATFFLTIFRDLTEAIVVGFALGSVLFIHRMSRTTDSRRQRLRRSRRGRHRAPARRLRGGRAQNPDVVVYRITGALFFGATASIGSVLDRIPDTHKALIVDFASVPFLNSTGANMIEGLAHKARKQGVALWLTGASQEIRRVFAAHGLEPPRVHYARTADEAVAQVRKAAASEREAA